jgi:elongation factor G
MCESFLEIRSRILRGSRSSRLNAQVPLAEMFGYATAIRSLSKGRASYSMEPLSFAQVPNSVLTTILDQAAKKPAART